MYLDDFEHKIKERYIQKFIKQEIYTFKYLIKRNIYLQ